MRSRAVESTAVALALLALPACAPDQDQTPGSPETGDAPPTGEQPMETMQPAPGDRAQAMMVDSTGAEVGVIAFTLENGGVRVQGHLRLAGQEPGQRGFHVHEVGECEPPTFESAGGHFDPHDTPHGGPDDPPGERHVGDLGNVRVGEDGSIEVDLLDEVIALDGADGVVGRALMVHAGEDDLETQPTGNAGDRVACGVIEG